MVIALLFSALAVVFSVGGCGDSEEDGSGDAAGTTPTIGKAEFIKKADAICSRTSGKIAETTSNALAKFADDPAALKEGMADVVPTLFVPRVEEEIAEIRSLGSPPGDEDQIDAFLNALQAVVDQAEEDPEAFARADFTSPAENPYQEADELADKYGFKKCPRV
jgi:hypothetical protein